MLISTYFQQYGLCALLMVTPTRTGPTTDIIAAGFHLSIYLGFPWIWEPRKNHWDMHTSSEANPLQAARCEEYIVAVAEAIWLPMLVVSL